MSNVSLTVPGLYSEENSLFHMSRTILGSVTISSLTFTLIGILCFLRGPRRFNVDHNTRGLLVQCFTISDISFLLYALSSHSQLFIKELAGNNKVFT